MRSKLAIGAVLAASISTVSSQACDPGTAHLLGGNWYCSAVQAITYTNVGSSGTYNEIVSMNGGSCSSRPKAYSGPLAPLNEEGYYNSAEGQADGLVFLNHHGGDKSGVFDYALGNSLSYASTDGCNGAASPMILADKLLPDNKEIVIMTDKPCNGDCGTVRPGTVAYHGFDGDNKLFLTEFSMPNTGKTGWNEDMPAAWILNAAIPRTLQYGKPECSCWISGCGEFDVFEVLDAGNPRAKSTLHGNRSGGDSHWFPRPISKTLKLAVLFDGAANSVNIRILDDSFEFKPTLDGSEIAAMLAEKVESASTFAVV
ncbi:conserved hypothetical protein [Histoplasma capsulatum H143]|uniref:Cell wall protein YJL171C/Tos1 C-terminal domain-containing protein n=1 Tax=Ajellomyces capsulatus (strain H143) TaxID=544712 RepID=C6HG06_AJECH|nr:conserved hypothetical protein [Histoplasma capsulatum H143]